MIVFNCLPQVMALDKPRGKIWQMSYSNVEIHSPVGSKSECKAGICAEYTNACVNNLRPIWDPCDYLETYVALWGSQNN